MSDLKDSGKREDFETGCVRDAAENKSRPDLISPYFMMRVGDHLEKGASKYAERNWEKGMPISRCIASLERHLSQYKMGLIDEDHLAAISCNIMFIIHYEAMIERGLLPEELADMPLYEKIKESTDEKNTDVCIVNDPAYPVHGVLCYCKACLIRRHNHNVSEAGESTDR